jgi:shikimate kinase
VKFDRHIVLIGMMGAGKSTVGRLLATQLGRPFWDNDDALLEATGKTAAELQRLENQAALHRWENRLLAAALQNPKPMVFAAAGSVALEPNLIRDALTIWLRIGANREAANLARSGQLHRPLPSDPSDVLRRMGSERERMYSRLADITVDVADGAEPTLERVLAALGRRAGFGPPEGPKSGSAPM